MPDTVITEAPPIPKHLETAGCLPPRLVEPSDLCSASVQTDTTTLRSPVFRLLSSDSNSAPTLKGDANNYLNTSSPKHFNT